MPHTPGPWVVSGISGALVYASQPVGSPKVIADANSSVLPDEESRANARLIAAAPDLYEAMRGAMEYLDETLGPCEDGCECLLHSFHAALAKAEGR